MTKAQSTKIKKRLKELVKLRDGDGCAKCGKKKALHLSHIVPVGRCKRMEHYHRNVKLLCTKHHLHWWHKHPLAASRWFKEQFGVEWELELDSMEKRIGHDKRAYRYLLDYDEVNKQIDREMKQYKNNDIWI